MLPFQDQKMCVPGSRRLASAGTSGEEGRRGSSPLRHGTSPRFRKTASAGARMEKTTAGRVVHLSYTERRGRRQTVHLIVFPSLGIFSCVFFLEKNNARFERGL